MKLKDLTFQYKPKFWKGLCKKVCGVIKKETNLNLLKYNPSIEPLFNDNQSGYYKSFLFVLKIKCTKKQYTNLETTLDDYRCTENGLGEFLYKNLLFYIGDGDDWGALEYNKKTKEARLWVRCFEGHNFYYTRKAIKNKDCDLFNLNLGNLVYTIHDNLLGCIYEGNSRKLYGTEYLDVLCVKYNKNELYTEIDFNMSKSVYIDGKTNVKKSTEYLIKKLKTLICFEVEHIKFHVSVIKVNGSNFTVGFAPILTYKLLDLELVRGNLIKLEKNEYSSTIENCDSYIRGIEPVLKESIDSLGNNNG